MPLCMRDNIIHYKFVLYDLTTFQEKLNCGFSISVINVCFHVVFIMRLVQSERSRVLTMIIQNVTLARARAS